MSENKILIGVDTNGIIIVGIDIEYASDETIAEEIRDLSQRGYSVHFTDNVTIGSHYETKIIPARIKAVIEEIEKLDIIDECCMEQWQQFKTRYGV